MIFEFGGAPELAAPREVVWRQLQDGGAMAACTPGAESFDVLGPGRYSVRCRVGTGLLTAHVDLEAELHDLVPPASLHLRATGTAPGSSLDVATQVRLEVVSPGTTRLEWRSTTTVHGMLTSLGHGMVEVTLRRFTESFWANVVERVATTPRTTPRALSIADLLALPSGSLDGAVLLGAVAAGGRRLPKGHRLGAADAAALLVEAARGDLTGPVRLAWIGGQDLHESEAARQLANAVAGPGVTLQAASLGRIDLVATHAGVLSLSLTGLEEVNGVDALEVFTRWNHQPVERGEAVASVKVAPFVVEQQVVDEGVRRAAAHAALISVRPYTGATLGALIVEPLPPDARDRFESAARLRAESLGGGFGGVVDVTGSDPEAVSAALCGALDDLALHRRVDVLLVGGVSAGDPLSPLLSALATLGGEILRRGIPAHPGSMLWVGRLGATQLLGLPKCGAFGMATAADLLLPRMMAGEQLTLEALAELGHGGMLGRDMRARFPAYARVLPDLEGS
ncbi:MAG TPA: SRPBCC domain-containing protein [Gemmatimonadales bacterium]|nr:SRPBCC domain-containing protein [Gemmatimonadales bacterium]